MYGILRHFVRLSTNLGLLTSYKPHKDHQVFVGFLLHFCYAQEVTERRLILLDGSNFFFKLKSLQLHNLLSFDFTAFSSLLCLP